MGRHKSRDQQVVGGKRRFFTLKKKLLIISEHLRLGSTYYETGKKHGVQGNQIKRWVAKKDAIQTAAQRSIRALTVHPGRDPVNKAVEEGCLDYVHALRSEDIAVSTNMIIIKHSR